MDHEISDEQITLAQSRHVDDDRFNHLPTSENFLSGQVYTTGQDHLLPIANVGRIMKKGLPANAKISKEAKETMQECASEFIGFITVEAADSCQKNNRKTLNGDDICGAMRTLGLDNYADTMRRYLDRYKEYEEIRASSVDHNKFTSINLVDELSVAKSSSSYRGHHTNPSPDE
ncbi:nuclear transcription factor Y subunit B-4-like [Canna indica]|uniref:Nuclear transcription factor Y subunit B-4-like n=1 Tax=Canna indica TaxID=4628 RepID=A0AAQ3KEJ0_9LILI|nr:nuclear transcription factor Y subunit B-4-like [Canna indica]